MWWYTLVWIVLWPVALAVMVFKYGWRSTFSGFKQRLGFVPANPRSAIRNPQSVIWVHAASLGEIRAAKPFIRAVKDAYPNLTILVTSLTKTGLDLAKSEGIGDIWNLAPLDFVPLIKRFVKHIKPSSLIIVETEIWPAMITGAKKAGAKVAIVNGRMSEKAFRRYRWIRRFLTPALENVCICCREPKDAERFVSAGANAGRIHVTGNLKYDAVPQNISKKSFSHLVFTAGSTWPGEEEPVISAWITARKYKDDLKLILAPRHNKRTGEIITLLEKYKCNFILKSQAGFDALNDAACNVLLLDTMGELLEAYAISALAFVGGSLIPRGGQNPVEPAIMGIPVLFGPHMENFSEVAPILVRNNGAIQVNDGKEFTQNLIRIVNDENLRKYMGDNAKKIIATITGATQRTIAVLRDSGIL